jgi:uncharacterized protein YdiU (UPF0061 family)
MMKNLNFNFDNTYANLPDLMATKLAPIAVKKPELIIFNKELADELSLDFSNINDQELAEIFSGNTLPEGICTLSTSLLWSPIWPFCNARRRSCNFTWRASQ